MAVILTKLLIIKSVSEIQCLMHWFFLFFYVGSSRLRAAVCWNIGENMENIELEAAAFGRLCVETNQVQGWLWHCVAAAFGRLCVETLGRSLRWHSYDWQPPSGGCVLKRCTVINACCVTRCSRLRAAVCWNNRLFIDQIPFFRSRLRAAVCWNCHWRIYQRTIRAAAFGRLCVETFKALLRLTH